GLRSIEVDSTAPEFRQGCSHVAGRRADAATQLQDLLWLLLQNETVEKAPLLLSHPPRLILHRCGDPISYSHDFTIPFSEHSPQARAPLFRLADIATEKFFDLQAASENDGTAAQLQERYRIGIFAADIVGLLTPLSAALAEEGNGLTPV